MLEGDHVAVSMVESGDDEVGGHAVQDVGLVSSDRQARPRGAFSNDRFCGNLKR